MFDPERTIFVAVNDTVWMTSESTRCFMSTRCSIYHHYLAMRFPFIIKLLQKLERRHTANFCMQLAFVRCE